VVNPLRERRLVVAAGSLAVLLGFIGSAGASAGKIEIRRIDTASYPLIGVMVVMPVAGTKAPTLTEAGQSVSGLIAANLADQESVALVVDHSQSMHGLSLAAAKRAAEAFVAEKQSADQIGVFAVASQATLLASVSRDASQSDSVLQSLSIDPRYGTVLWDAVRLAANSLRSHGLRGRTIILVTDGQNTTSKATLEDAIKTARDAHAAVYTIGIPDATYRPRPLEELAAATGGHFYRAASSSHLPSIYREIGSELRRTWLLEYPTADRPGDVLRVEVQYKGERASAATTLPLKLEAPASNANEALTLLRDLAYVAAALVVGTAVVRTARRLRGSGGTFQ